MHVIGAGVAGLAAAHGVARAGRRVIIHEQSPLPGGRCRSWRDATLDRVIDNGNHLLMRANPAALNFLDEIGADKPLAGPGEARFDFADLRDGATWSLRPNRGPVPWWVLSKARRTPGAGARAHLEGLRLMRAGADATVADCFDVQAPLYERLWRPLCEGVMNAAAEDSSAKLLARVFAETFMKGGRAMEPFIARTTLTDAFVTPAIRRIEALGGELRTGVRLRALGLEHGRVASLHFGDGDIPLAPSDSVILAVPAHIAAELLPDLTVPEGSRPIVNAHFRTPSPATDRPRFFGLVGTAAQWAFLRDDVISVTVSAADSFAGQSAETLGHQLWRETAQGLTMLGGPKFNPALIPPFRIVKEKRATFLQSPEQVNRRAKTADGPSGLVLAGDWTNTGLPATIEGAIRSGVAASKSTLTLALTS